MPCCMVPDSSAERTSRLSPTTATARPVSAAMARNRCTSSTAGTSDARGPPQRSLGSQRFSATRRTASSQAATSSASPVMGRRGSTTAVTSSGTNSATRSSQTGSRSTGADVSTVRGVSSVARENTVDNAFGTDPRPLSTTRASSTGAAGADRASSVTSGESRDTGHTRRPSRPPWSPSRVSR